MAFEIRTQETRRDPPLRSPRMLFPVPLLGIVLVGLQILSLTLAIPSEATEPAATGTETMHAESAGRPVFDLVIRGGRVIDPESGLDGVRQIGIRAGRIAALSEDELEAPDVLDATGLVVSPGFIDLHTHSPTPLGQHYQLLDGVTTALELEAGAWPVRHFGEAIEGRALIHYGTSAGYGSIRLETKLGIRQTHLLTSEPELVGWRGRWTAFRSLFTRPTEVVSERADEDERARMRQMLLVGLDEGGLGIGLPLDYISEAVDEAELAMVFEVASERSVPLFIHLRRGVNGDPSGLREALRLAEAKGTALHICHIQHNAMGGIELFLREIREARSRGVDVTTETLPYNAGSALISSAVFSRNWQEIFDIDYEDVEWAATGERFDEASWHRARAETPDGQVIHHYVKESWTQRAVREPGVLVVSDLLPMIDESSKVAPHNGAFSKVLGRYVRDAGLLDLSTGIARMTLLPARRLERAFPRFADKGRIRVGADADLTIFDAEKILDRASYRDPYQGSTGIAHVVIDGIPVVRDASIVPDTFPGRNLSRPGLASSRVP